jgi:hypothetical protein
MDKEPPWTTDTTVRPGLFDRSRGEALSHSHRGFSPVRKRSSKPNEPFQRFPERTLELGEEETVETVRCLFRWLFVTASSFHYRKFGKAALGCASHSHRGFSPA